MKIEEKVLSERMRDFLCEMDLDMADEDMVEIIKRSPMLSWKERVRALEELAGKTKDLYLSDRIHSGLAMEKIAYNDFRSPKDDYLFALIGNEPHVAPRYVLKQSNWQKQEERSWEFPSVSTKFRLC